MRIRKLRVLGLLALSVAVVACEGDQQEAAGGGEPQWTSQSQVYRSSPSTTPPREGVGISPEVTVREFFKALGENQPQQAAQLVAKRPLEGGEEQLATSLSQWAADVSRSGQQFEVIDSNQRGDFALVRVDFLGSTGAEPSSESVRPVVMFREEGHWRIVWDLLGKEPERLDPATAQRLQPLYSWYESAQLRYVARPAQPQAGSEQPAAGQSAQAPAPAQGQPGQAASGQAAPQQSAREPSGAAGQSG